MDEYESLSHTAWDCKYHVVFIPKCRRKTLYHPHKWGRRSAFPGQAFAAALFLRLASVLKRSALSLMKPAASCWS